MNIKELIKGIFIGIAKIIPGFSGAILMISFNLYDRAILAITCFFENPKKNFCFLANLGLGIIIGIVVFSKIIIFFLEHYYVYTTALFIGLILGGIPILQTKFTRNKTNSLILILSFFIMFILSIANINNNYLIKNNYIDILVFFLSGILEAIGTILPGISATALLMLVGIYDSYITILSNAFNLHLLKETLYFIIPFSSGLIFGIITISLLINYLLKHYKEQTFSLILGISFSSVILLILKISPLISNLSTLLISFLLLTIGYLITFKL